jgi:hypothetical protein
MKILYVGLARTIWLFNFALVNPTGINLRGVFDALGKRYQFGKTPKNEIDFDDQNSLSFKSGTFVGQRKVPLLIDLNIYNDGIVVDARSSTDESTEFLNDVANWLQDTYGLAIPKERRVAYLSQIDFQWDVSLGNLNPGLAALAGQANEHSVPKSEFEVASIQFWTEGFSRPNAPAPLKIERKIPAPFSSNHYFSQAPMETKDHIAFLNAFEALLGGK